MSEAKGRVWYEFRAAADPASAELFLYSDIGAFGISASDFAKDLRALGRVKRIDLRINSAGGDVFQGNAIYNMLQRSPARIVVHVDGVAASMASLIAMVGDEVVMPSNAMMMIHDPAGGVLGTAKDMKDMAAVLEKLRDGMVAAYASKTGLSPDEIRGLMAEETWMDAEEAVELGFADRVEDAVAVAASVDLSKFAHPPTARVAATKENDMVKKIEGETHEDMEARLTKELTASITESVKASLKAEADAAEAKRAAEAGKETPEQVVARVTAEVSAKVKSDAAQIKALCDLAGRPSLAAQFIAEGKSVADVTADLAKKRADGVKSEDEVSARHSVDGGPKGGQEAKGLEVGSVYGRWNGAKGKRAA